MDGLTYNYIGNTNKLLQVADAVSAGAYSVDIDNQPTSNYAYDEIGNMVKDSAQSIRSIAWTVYGKIKSIRKTNNDSLIFLYNASGERVRKMDKPASGPITATYYIGDAGGNNLAVYGRTTNGINYEYRQKEVNIYTVTIE